LQVLQSIASISDPSNENSFQAAVCLGMICGIHDEASAAISTKKLLSVIQVNVIILHAY